MLEQLHLRGIDRAELTPEQWAIIYEFITHNFGNLVNDACLVLQLVHKGQFDVSRAGVIDSQLKRHYYEIIGTLRAYRDGEEIPLCPPLIKGESEEGPVKKGKSDGNEEDGG